MQGFLCQSTKFTKKCAKIKLEHYKFQQAITLQILVRFKKIQNVLKSEWWDLCLWSFMDFTHGQIYSSGSPDMEWPTH